MKIGLVPELKAELETLSHKALSRRLGVSDNALGNRLCAYEAGRRPGEGPMSGGGKLPGQLGDPSDRSGANTDDVAAIAGHSVNVQAEHYRQALNRSSEFIRAAIG